MISLLSLRKLIIPLLLVVSLAGAGFAVYQAGKANQRTNSLEAQIERIEQITDAISEGRREVREANPSNDPAVSRERLLNRQQNR